MTGARNRAENYRPISLTAVVCKLMERFKEAIINHGTNNKLLSTKQYGFITEDPRPHNLRYLDECIENIVDGKGRSCYIFRFR